MRSRSGLKWGSITGVVAYPGRLARRRSTLIALAAALVLSSASCGDSSAPVATADDGPTRTVVDVEGTEVEVPVEPQRIVTLSEPALDGVLALGLTPVGTVTGRGQSTVPNHLAERAGDIELLGGVAQPNFEAIGRARPDLILVDGTSINNNPPVIEALRRIAPTVYTGYAGGDWRATFGVLADAVNLETEGAEVLAAYDDRAEQVAAALPADVRRSTFSIVRWQGSSASMILKELPPGQALTDLGLARPPGQDRMGRGHSEPVSLENLAEIDADYIFFGTLGGASVDNRQGTGGSDIGAAETALAEAAQVPGFTSLGAYNADHIIPVDGSLWTSTGGPLLMKAIVDDVEEALG